MSEKEGSELEKDKLYTQFDALVSLKPLYKNRDKYRRKLRQLEKTKKARSEQKVKEDLYEISKSIMDNKKEIENLSKKVNRENNLFLILDEANKLRKQLFNLERGRKKRTVSEQSFKTLELEYSQKLEEELKLFNDLQSTATVFYQRTLEEQLNEERRRVVLWGKKWREDSVSKEAYKVERDRIENRKKNLEKILKFLKYKIITFRINM